MSGHWVTDSAVTEDHSADRYMSCQRQGSAVTLTVTPGRERGPGTIMV